MDWLLEADRHTGLVAGLPLLRPALAELRTRVVRTLSSLEIDEWLRPSRCERWSVHDVARHTRDVCRIHLARLRRDPAPFPTDRPFDGRTAPLEWLEQTAGETPAETLLDFEQLAAAELDALAARIDVGGGGIEPGPYGSIHWTLLSTHIFWDAWIHERDITKALGRAHPSTPNEDSVAALYGFLVASLPAAFAGHSFQVTVGLKAPTRQRLIVRVTPGSAALRSAGSDEQLELVGELGSVLDGLTGRGSELETVLVGDPATLEPLTWLRAFMVPPAAPLQDATDA